MATMIKIGDRVRFMIAQNWVRGQIIDIDIVCDSDGVSTNMTIQKLDGNCLVLPVDADWLADAQFRVIFRG